MNWLEENHILAEEQNGFRKNRSCLDHLYTLNNIVRFQKSKKRSTYVCFIDAKKAFDIVNRTCLWYKLKKMGINGKMMGAIESLYQNINCAI